MRILSVTINESSQAVNEDHIKNFVEETLKLNVMRKKLKIMSPSGKNVVFMNHLDSNVFGKQHDASVCQSTDNFIYTILQWKHPHLMSYEPILNLNPWS